MPDAFSTVYRKTVFFVDFKENPMFAGVKQGSLRREFGVELGLWAHIDLAVVEPAVDHHGPLNLAHPQLRGIGQYFDHYRRVGAVVVIHGQAV